MKTTTNFALHTHLHLHLRTYIYTHTYTHTYTYTHTCKYSDIHSLTMTLHFTILPFWNNYYVVLTSYYGCI